MDKYTCKHDDVNVVDYYCIHHFVDSIIDELFATSDEYANTSIIANEYFTQDLIKILLSKEIGFDMKMVNFDTEDYSEEYIVDITKDMELFCEPAYRNNEYGKDYVYGESNHAYVLEDSNFKVLDKIGSDDITIFGFEDEE